MGVKTTVSPMIVTFNPDVLFLFLSCEREKEAKRERRRYVFQEAILTSLKLGTILSVGLLMPNVMRVIKMLGWIPTARDPKYSLENAITRLKNKGLIVTVMGRGRVMSQSITAGTNFSKGQKISLILN